MKSDLAWSVGIIVGALLIGGGGYAVYTMTRGLRNNNPGNIEYDGTTWEGLATPPSDGTFFVFIDAVYGIRAMGRVLSNYVALDGVPSTVSALITRWAPPTENDTPAYIADVDAQLGLTPGNDAIDLAVSLPALVAAIIQHENGLQPYSAATIAQGLSLA